MNGVWAWILHVTGVKSEAGRWYAFWSGFGSCLGYFGALAVIWRRWVCHTTGCWRIGRHHVDGTPYTVCARHHPDVPGKVSAEHVRRSSRRRASKP